MKFKLVVFTFFAFSLLYSCGQFQSANNSKVENGMIKVTILYPNGEGKTFDMDYYSSKHMPMLSSLFGE